MDKASFSVIPVLATLTNTQAFTSSDSNFRGSINCKFSRFNLGNVNVCYHARRQYDKSSVGGEQKLDTTYVKRCCRYRLPHGFGCYRHALGLCYLVSPVSSCLRRITQRMRSKGQPGGLSVRYSYCSRKCSFSGLNQNNQ